MMELFLNAAWVVVCAVGIIGLGQRRSGWRLQKLFLGALFCAAVTLFPVISASDDIHSPPFMIEDSRSTKHLVSATSAGATSVVLCFGRSGPALLFGGLARYCWPVIETSSSFLQSPLLIQDVLGRAPPVVRTTDGGVRQRTR
jgi:hypothetical protein